jgi:hypothetical protein
MNDRLLNIARQAWVVPTAIGVTAFCGGLGLGYVIAKEKVKERLIEELEADVDYVINHMDEEDTEPEDYQVVVTPRSDPTKITVDEEELDKREGLYSRYGVLPYDEIDQEELDHLKVQEENRVNVFATSSDNWVYQSEIENRSTEEPYVIHKDEFWVEEFNYDQSTLTYFEIDDILIDDKDTPVYNYPSIIGELKFGHGSEDQNVFYVRNDRLKSEYEVLLDKGSYAVEVLGLEYEQEKEEEILRHSVSKFKPDD